MSNERDPFPMTSKEAKQLEESVAGAVSEEEKSKSKKWSSMDTQVEAHRRGSSSVDDQDEASSSLVSGKKKQLSGKNGDDDEDIYSGADLPEDDADQEDDFLDIPLPELRGTRWDRMRGNTKRGALKLYHRLYGDKLPPSEMLRVLWLATTLFFMIGGYWLLRSLKDPVLMALCGYRAIPKAKMLSVFVVLGVVSVYNHLLDSDMPKHHLFYIFGTFYFFLFATIALCLMNDSIGLANKHVNENRILGWISYCSIESFGSVMVSLFWSFANSNIRLETAKASYGVMVALAQIGSICGPTIVNVYGTTWGPAKCYLLGSFFMLLLQGTMYSYIRAYGTMEQPKKKKARAGITEGLVLFWEHNYVKGVFAISCLFMVEVTIVDFTMKVLAQDFFAKEFPCDINSDCYDKETGEYGLTEEATNSITSFMGLFGMATNSLSFLFSLLGTSAVIRYLGLRWTLLLFPSLCLMVIIFVRLHPTLYVVFGAMMLLKGFSYALNNPTKEILYQPTSAAVRYKAKSWIDIFGARGSKALGSLVTNAFSHSSAALVANGSLVGMAVASFLIWNARFMGKKFEEYTESGYIVGDESNPESQNIEMAVGQNEGEETSCAIAEDDEDDDPDDEELADSKRDDESGQPSSKSKAEVAMV